MINFPTLLRLAASSPRHLWPLLALLALVLLISWHSISSLHPTSHPHLPSALTTFPHDPHNLLAYRNHLERTTSPLAQITHSSTLTFDKIYVLSLPTRTDRREEMSKLARALGLDIEFVDAVNKDAEFLRWIAERTAETRARKRTLLAQARGRRASAFGGTGIGSPWLDLSQDRSGTLPFPSLTEERYAPLSWVGHLEAHDSAGTLGSLVPDSDGANISVLLRDPLEKDEIHQVDAGVLSTFWGHTRVLKRLAERGESALVLEDDVDVEFDLERLWSRIERKLPDEWDIVFLGHCWGHERLKPMYLHPLLHQSTAPKCLHGYAVSSLGASRLLKVLNDPWTAFQTSVDAAVPTYISAGLITSFSVEPPLIIQRKDGPSDVHSGNGTRWRGVLRDSTMDRVWKDEGREVIEGEWDEGATDPATRFREKDCKRPGLG